MSRTATTSTCGLPASGLTQADSTPVRPSAENFTA